MSALTDDDRVTLARAIENGYDPVRSAVDGAALFAAVEALLTLHRAEAWDEGWDERDNDCSEPFSPPKVNPYREEEQP